MAKDRRDRRAVEGMMDIDSFSGAVAQIYDASLDVAGWDAALTTLMRLFDADKAQLSYFESFLDTNPLFRFVGFDPRGLDATVEAYRSLSATDPRRPPRLFKAYHCRQLVSEQILHATDIYQQALAPAGVEYAMFVFLEVPDQGARCMFGVMRGPSGSAFTEAECEDFGRFSPHVTRAISLHGALRRAYDQAQVAHALLDGVPLGMVVLSGKRIVMTNAAADRLLERGDALRRRGDQLQAVTPRDEAQLEQALRDAKRGEAVVGVTLQGGDPGQVKAAVRRLSPQSASALGVGSEALGIYLSDAREPLETRDELVRRLFGLTEREAAVLNALAQGADTRGIATRLGVGVETVKTHLQHVMQAVGVRRQAELVKLVLSSPAWIANPPADSAAAAPNFEAPPPKE